MQQKHMNLVQPGPGEWPHGPWPSGRSVGFWPCWKTMAFFWGFVFGLPKLEDSHGKNLQVAKFFASRFPVEWWDEYLCQGWTAQYCAKPGDGITPQYCSGRRLVEMFHSWPNFRCFTWAMALMVSGVWGSEVQSFLWDYLSGWAFFSCSMRVTRFDLQP